MLRQGWGGGVAALVCRGGTELVPVGSPDSTVTALEVGTAGTGDGQDGGTDVERDPHMLGVRWERPRTRWTAAAVQLKIKVLAKRSR